MDPFEVRELRYFVAVAEELSFARAAERLGIPRPPLSSAIGQLERRLGADLFQREPRVALTDLGASLLDPARDALDVMAAVTRRAHRATQAAPALVVTAKPGIATEMLRRIADEYARLAGVPPVELVASGYLEQAAMVRDGRADLALLGSPYDRRRLDTEVLDRHPRVAALPAEHPLASNDLLHCRDLHPEPMPRWAGSSAAEQAYATGRDILRAAPPANGPVVRDTAQLLEAVGSGAAVALVPTWLAERNPRPDVVYRPVADASPYTTVIAWPQGARAQPVARFVRTATELYRLMRSVNSAQADGAKARTGPAGFLLSRTATTSG